MVGWGPHFEDLAAGLAEFAVEGTRVNVINPERPRGLPEQPLRGCQFNHIQGSATSFNSFREAELADCDSILLGQPPLLATALHSTLLLCQLVAKACLLYARLFVDHWEVPCGSGVIRRCALSSDETLSTKTKGVLLSSASC